jgi:hypothetical protein
LRRIRWFPCTSRICSRSRSTSRQWRRRLRVIRRRWGKWRLSLRGWRRSCRIPRRSTSTRRGGSSRRRRKGGVKKTALKLCCRIRGSQEEVLIWRFEQLEILIFISERGDTHRKQH